MSRPTPKYEIVAGRGGRRFIRTTASSRDGAVDQYGVFHKRLDLISDQDVRDNVAAHQREHTGGIPRIKGKLYVDSFIIDLVEHGVDYALGNRVATDALIASLHVLAPNFFLAETGTETYVSLRIREMSLAWLICEADIRDRIVGEIAQTTGHTTEDIEAMLSELAS